MPSGRRTAVACRTGSRLCDLPSPRTPWWTPKIWHGMRSGDVLRLLAANRFRVHPYRWPMTVSVLLVSVFNSLWSWRTQLQYGRRVAATEIPRPPVFVIGHWRTGTTYLHELLACDDRFAYPTYYECFAPHHFLATEWLVPKLLRLLLPSTRPTDDVIVGFDRPQEDEFAICNMGAPSPYRRFAFPNHDPPCLELLDMDGVEDRDQERFKEALLWFIKALTYRHRKPLVLKSPPHTGRIGLLSELLPGAKFVHMVRDPYEIFASTQRLWRALELSQGFQVPRGANLDESIFDGLVRMYREFERQRSAIEPARIRDVRYERLVRDPLGVMEGLYRDLDLGEFKYVGPALARYTEGRQDYRAGRHELSPETKEKIDERWGSYAERYGYSGPSG